MYVRYSGFFLMICLLASCASQDPRPSSIERANCAILGLEGKAIQGFARVDRLSQITSLLDAIELPTGSTLYVVDIDDTLLESEGFVGGDAWYRWQTWREGKQQVFMPDGMPIKVSPDEKFACPYNVLSTLYAYGLYRTTEPAGPAIVSDWLRRGDFMLLTSRSPAYRDGTRRELAEAGYPNLADEHLMKGNRPTVAFSLDGRAVVYQDGIAMSTGAHKGEVLDRILSLVGKEYTDIVFVDDGFKNIENMIATWGGKESTRLHAFHYTKVDKCVSREDIAESIAAKSDFEQFLDTAFGGVSRFAAFHAEGCR